MFLGGSGNGQMITKTKDQLRNEFLSALSGAAGVINAEAFDRPNDHLPIAITAFIRGMLGTARNDRDRVARIIVNSPQFFVGELATTLVRSDLHPILMEVYQTALKLHYYVPNEPDEPRVSDR